MPVQSITAPAGPAPTETPVWSVSPSQWLNFGRFSFLGALTIVGLIVLLILRAHLTDPRMRELNLIAIGLLFVWVAFRTTIAYMRVAATKYDLTDQRLLITTGIFGRHRREIELRRVQDFAVQEPFWLRVVGLGNLLVYTADRATGDIVLRALRPPKQMDVQIRQVVRAAQATAGTREVNVL
jgi:uncharacterized membrane protein YdbT with pleckstrin-like domain